MQLYVMRHGQATSFDSSVTLLKDISRELTEQGRVETADMTKWLKHQVNDIDLLLVSPYTRAQQTAAIVQQQLAIKKVVCLDMLVPEGNSFDVHNYLDGLLIDQPIKHVLIVSHMPLVSYLVAEFVVDHPTPIFQTAAIAQIDYYQDKMHGRLVQLVAPSDLP